jgi:sigma-B regulation protein RsbU (phosphoserine phosphatase)
MNRIIVIEDDLAILRGLADNLRAESYDVLTATDGEDGYRMVCEKRPDLVILDLMLPKLNGYDVCRQIRSHGIATPILMLTAQDGESNRIQGFDAGADDYVTKPFSIRELLGRVRAILRRSEGRSDLANQKELDDARQIQQRLMPKDIAKVPGLRIAGTWIPARIVGGDYYDVLIIDDCTVAVCIADVCGKGMPAAIIMSSLQASVKAFASKRMHPRELCERVNRAMCESTQEDRFVSFFYAVIDARSKRLTYCNAGHNPPILATGTRESGSAKRLDCGGTVLGFFSDWKYEEQEVRMLSGDRILMYTDGITENRNAAGEEYGEDRLCCLVRAFEDIDAAGLTEEVIGAANRFSNGNFEDDLTVVAVLIE